MKIKTNAKLRQVTFTGVSNESKAADCETKIGDYSTKVTVSEGDKGNIDVFIEKWNDI